MLKKSIQRLSLLLIFVLASCENHAPSSTPIADSLVKNSVKLYDSHDKLIIVSEKKENYSRVKQVLSNRRVMLKKILPIFDLTLVLKEGDNVEEWQFARPNYLRKNNESEIFVTKENLNLYSLLEKLD